MLDSLIALKGREAPKESIMEFLNNSYYDEMVGIDLNEDHFKFFYNIEDKYRVPAKEGPYSRFYEYTVDHLIHADDRELYARHLNPRTLRAELAQSKLPGATDIQYRVRTPEGGWRWVEQVTVGGDIAGLPDGLIYCYIYDIQNIKDREAGITRVRSSAQVRRDTLTGLVKGDDFFSAAASTLENRNVNWMLLVIDLEQFKLFNEWYGRKMGDLVLARIGSGLAGDAERGEGLAGYMGNDDFCLLTPVGTVDTEDLYRKIHGVIVRYGVSIGFLPSFGISYSNGNTSILNLYDQASLACQRAKRDFKDRIVTFDPSMYNKTAEDYRILSSFQDALKNDEITFYLQPQCRASTGGIVGAESLARWIKPGGQMVPPAAFVPVLEKYGFIPDLDKYVWEAVCRWSRACLDRGLPLVPVSVNVSRVDIFTMNVAEHFCALLERYGLPKNALKIEITESAIGEDTGKVRSTIQSLRERGFVVLMDDFGSGYSSLNMLHDINIDVIKLDGSFLHLNEASERKGMHILESVVNMTRTLALPIIVEGVETEAQKEYLMHLGCRYVQGFYFYRPMPPEAFEKLMADPEKMDDVGFIFKANEQFRIREFLNDAIYSDSMLNNIIGPAAIYARRGSGVDIVRFNQQFFEAVDVPDFNQKMKDIQSFMPERDAARMRELLDAAYRDRLNGASGTLTFMRTDGGFSRFLIHFYFLNESDGVQRFYGAARDVTELTNLSRHMELLSRFSSHTVVFLEMQHGRTRFEVVAHGLEKAMKVTKAWMEAELNAGTFYKRLEPEWRDDLKRKFIQAIRAEKSFNADFRMTVEGGEPLNLCVRGDYVNDATSDVKCILSIRLADE